MSLSLCLEQFSIIVQAQESFCYINDKILVSQDNANLQNTTGFLANYPKFIVDNENLLNQNAEETQVLFQQNDDILLKRLIRTYLDQGFMNFLNMAADMYDNSNESRIITFPAFCLRKGLNWFCDIQYTLQPHLKEISENYMLHYSTRDWKNSSVRYISWHPMCSRLAIATIDDSIRIFNCAQSNFMPFLRGRNQRNISCLSWRPFAAFDIAVGTSIGIILWKIDPNSIVSRPSMANASILRQSDVCNLSWNNLGTLLIASSLFSGFVTIWDCEQEICEKVWCSRSGVNLVTWALNTHYVFNSGIDSTYKVWDTSDWSVTKWRLHKGIVQTACWTPCGNHLIFATTEEPIVFTVNMNVALSPNKSSTPLMGPSCLLETTRISTQLGEPCGGLIQNIKISPKGSHVAIMFKFTNYIAVCKLNISCTMLNIYPCFLFCGLSGEQPSVIDFQHDYKKGTLLTVAWTTSRIQHIPITQQNIPDQ